MEQADPAGRFLTARWQQLAMLNYEIDPAILTPLVPAGTELDDWQGRTFVSMVGFRFLDTKVLGLPIPFHRNFDEINLRFYVRRLGPEGLRRGVVFVKEIVPRRAIAWVARTFYNERYVAHPMRHEDTPAGDGARTVAYAWQARGRWNRLAVRATGTPEFPDEVSEEAFITEHYWGYARQRDGGTVEYQVEHPRWQVWRVADATFDCDVADHYGTDFVEALTAPPSSAFLADGSEVIVRRGRRIV